MKRREKNRISIKREINQTVKAAVNVCFEMWFSSGHICTVTDLFGESAPEGGRSYGVVWCLVLSGRDKRWASEERRLQQ